MVGRVRMRSLARQTLARGRRGAVVVALALAALGLLVAASGCGSGLRNAESDDARADVDAITHTSCASTALQALGAVATRVYREGVSSERTVSALRMIESSPALRAAVEKGDAHGAQAAARALIATGHMTNLRVVRGGRVLVEEGGGAVAPLTGTLNDAAGKPIASFQTSVWADGGLIAEVNGIAEAQTVLRTAGRPASAQRDVAGAIALPRGELPPQGTLTRAGVAYEFTSFAAAAYPAGEPLRVYVLRTIASTAPLCGADDEATTFNTVSRIAHLIYDGEAGRRTLKQVRRVQGNAPLLNAVARRDPKATRKAIEALLHQHIVRLRVSAGGGRLLSDVGGPFVLAPVTAPLRVGGRTVGSFVMSIQDDEGYKRLANRLAGLDVLMYMGSKLVKSTLGPSPGAIPTSGPVRVRGRSYRAYTFTARAFPSGPLRITVLIPLPYS
jgi:hypothetical protein